MGLFAGSGNPSLKVEAEGLRLALRRERTAHAATRRELGELEAAREQYVAPAPIILNVAPLCAPDCPCKDASTGLAHSLALVPRDQAMTPAQAGGLVTPAQARAIAAEYAGPGQLRPQRNRASANART